MRAVAVALFALVVACTIGVRAGEVVTNETFVSGTSFEKIGYGAFDPVMSDEGDAGGPYHWAVDVTDNVAQVSRYLKGEAYDYGKKGLSRSAYLDLVEPATNRYLVLNGEDDLHRSIFGRSEYASTNAFTNVIVRAGTRESIYCDMLTQFDPIDGEASRCPDSRLVVWVRLRTVDEQEGTEETNLMVTAGCYTNAFRTVVARNYRLDTSEVCPDGFDMSRWYRLTIRNHGDVTATGNGGISVFSVYLDGKPLRAIADDYEIWDETSAHPSWLTPEARALWRDRRIFPSLAAIGTDAAHTMSGLTFIGTGLIDDITISSSDSIYAPAIGKPDTVFTLNWDGGVRELEYTLDGGRTTNAAPIASASAHSLDILLGTAATNGLVLKVTKCAYDEAGGYRPGVWAGSNGVTLTNDTEFVFDGTTRNPIASVASSCESIDIGPGCPYETFASAFAALDRSTNEIRRLRLLTNVVVQTMGRKTADAYGNYDAGFVNVTNATADYVLDLNGHTLRGSSPRNPTLSVKCRSLRICDGSEPDPVTKRKGGRILPVESYTNANENLNTAVEVYPVVAHGVSVEPLLVIEDGIYDGWVRNRVNAGSSDPTVGALVGTVIVEGGHYISTNAESFYLGSSITNAGLVYVWKDSYWSSRSVTNLMIWTGLGDGRRWADQGNWRPIRLPLATETAFFPSRNPGVAPWPVDVGNGQMTTKSFLLEGDIALSGTNDFLGVTLAEGSTGRICGDATLVFEGEQPGQLTETLLRADWAGTVLVRNVGYPTSKAAKILKDMEYWGTPDSKVEFNGVRGYVSDKYSHTMPYGLVLRDFITTTSGKAVTNLAWRNDSGYTGSTLEFGELEGDGTLQFGKTLKSIYQIVRFSAASNYTGRMDIKSKRLQIGGNAALDVAAGLVAFGNGTCVRANRGWTSQYASFSDTLYLIGWTNSVLITATAAEPNVLACSTLYLQCEPDGPFVPGVAWLACTNDPKYTVYVSGEPRIDSVATLMSVAPDNPLLSMLSAPGYTAAQYLLAEAQESAENVKVSLTIGEDAVMIVVTGANPNLWYGVRTRASLAAEWSEPVLWAKPNQGDSTVILSCPRTGDESCFYNIVVSQEDQSSAQ